MANKVEGLQYDDEKNWGRLIHIAKKHLDVWSHQTIRPYNGHLKLSYMPLIFNISPEGNTNTEISKKALIAKQAMSRTVKELEHMGMITSAPIKQDKRSYRINLTEEGKNYVQDANREMIKLIEQYKQLVGEADFNTTLEVLSKIIRFHETLGISDVSEEEV
jgi:DNA-binding MarR family transcriptional regulator